jgi:hypothetical protein
VLGTVAQAVVRADPAVVPLLDRFPAVYVQDSTVIALPDALAAEWPGCGGRTAQGTQAALKLQVRLEVRHGALRGPELHPGRAADHAGELVDDPGAPGSLHLRDLGYFWLDRLQAFAAADVYWLTRWKTGTRVVLRDGPAEELSPAALAQREPGPLDLAVEVGADHRLPCRLLAARVPLPVAEERRRKLRAQARRDGRTPRQAALAWADWTLLLTNVPAEQLSVPEALVLVRVRWQIELLFKLWKAQRRLGAWCSAKPWVILCELYAKLIGLVLQHWLLLVACWPAPERSLVKAAQVVGPSVGVLLAACRGRLSWAVAVAVITDGLQAACCVRRSRRYPSTAQLLRDPTLPLPFRPRPTPKRGRKPLTTRRKVA